MNFWDFGTLRGRTLVLYVDWMTHNARSTNGAAALWRAWIVGITIGSAVSSL